MICLCSYLIAPALWSIGYGLLWLICPVLGWIWGFIACFAAVCMGVVADIGAICPFSGAWLADMVFCGCCIG